MDAEKGRLHVRGSLTRVGVEAPWVIEPPTTQQAERAVDLPELAVLALRGWKAAQARERLLLGSEYEDHGFVFTPYHRTPLDESNVRR